MKHRRLIFWWLAILLAWFGRDGARGQAPCFSAGAHDVICPASTPLVQSRPSSPLDISGDDKGDIVFRLGSDEIRATPKQVFEALRKVLTPVSAGDWIVAGPLVRSVTPHPLDYWPKVIELDSITETIEIRKGGESRKVLPGILWHALEFYEQEVWRPRSAPKLPTTCANGELVQTVGDGQKYLCIENRWTTLLPGSYGVVSRPEPQKKGKK